MSRWAWSAQSPTPEKAGLPTRAGVASSSPGQAIEVRGLTKRFGWIAALRNVSVGVRPGETVVLWGPNGAGKTTLLRCVLGVIPYEGSVSVLGVDVRRRGKEARRQLGYVPQEIRLHDQQTVGETAAFYAALRGVPAAIAGARLEQWGLGRVREQRVQNLSGGMKQRLALALALLADPPVLLLDEPTSSLDLASRREFGALLERLHRSGKTLILCSHQIGEVWRLADRVIVLQQGQVVTEGAPEVVSRYLGEESLVGVVVAAAQKPNAAALLKARGFAVQCNGNARQLWVSVAPGQKAEPLRVLTEAHIPVLDLELASAAPPLGGPEAA